MSASLLAISRSPPAAPRDGTHRARVLVTRARALAALERHGDAEGAANAGLAVAGRGRYPPAQWRALALKADFARPTGRPGDADAYAARRAASCARSPILFRGRSAGRSSRPRTFPPDAGLDVPARARTHARHPSADVRKRFEVDAEARGELEPGRGRAVGDRAGADDVVLPRELSVENVQDLRHALPPALE